MPANRVTALGPVDANARYFKPPEPPIFVGPVSAEYQDALIVCPSCYRDLHPLSVERITRHQRAADPACLTTYVTLKRETFRAGESRPDGSCRYEDSTAFVGQCGRCQRIYIANARD